MTLAVSTPTLEVAETTYSEQEVRSACLDYFGDIFSSDVWMNKYALRNPNGQFIEKTPDDTHRRLAKEFARIERKYDDQIDKLDPSQLSEYGQTRKNLTEDDIFNLFKNFDYIMPAGSVMAILGNPNVFASLSNCVVLPKIFDSYGGICYTDQQLAQLYKRRCGCGIDISTLRPKDLKVTNAAGTTTGAVSFMPRFSNTTEEVGQNGRRGALMISIHIKHPDIMDFIKIKGNLEKVTRANISIRITDEFMQAVKDGTKFTHQWPVDSDNPEIVTESDAREVWNEICEHAWEWAEPGIMFWDRHHYYSPSSIYPQYKNVTSNPCSEITMQGGDSCRLVCVNFFSFVDNPFTDNAKIDEDKLYEICYLAQRIGDDLVDLEIEHIDRIIEKVKNDDEPDFIKQVELQTWELLRENGLKGRRTGVGLTGIADMIAALDMRYGSEESLEIVERIMRIKCKAEFDSSIDMSIERGTFDGFDPQVERESDFIKMMAEEIPDTYIRMHLNGRRNVSLSTVAPVGSGSYMTQTSSGCEPVFSLEYTRRRRVNDEDIISDDAVIHEDSDGKWQIYDVIHYKYNLWKEITGCDDESQSPYFGAVANDIDYDSRIKLQSILQKYTTHSISSTINLPKDVPVEQVKDLYMKAWEQGLKGLTVYRDGSRTGILAAKTNKADTDDDIIVETHAPKRPKVLSCDIHYSTIGGEQWIFLVGIYNGRPYEIFGGERSKLTIPMKFKGGWISKDGTDDKGRRIYDLILGNINDPDDQFVYKNIQEHFSSIKGSYTRIVSMILRHGIPMNIVHDQLLKTNDSDMFCFERGISRVLKKYVRDGDTSTTCCPQCNTKSLIYQEGCVVCRSCGFSGCS